ncbi:MAG: hypothetical protein ABFS42_13915 [Candidatus Krumholzibacteriota bacterium]
MRSNTWRAIMLLSLTLVLVSGAMDAQAARRSSLAGNQFINDADDMFAFPQLLHKYKNRVIIDMAPGNGDEGNASVVFGDNMVWNFNTGRSDFLNNTATWAAGSADRFGTFPMFGVPGIIEDPMEWWDLGLATHLGDTPFGVNISYASSKDEFTGGTPGADVDESLSMLSLQAGITLGTIDLAAEVGFGGYEDKSDGLDPQNQNDYGMFNFSLLARGDLEDMGGLDWRWIAAFGNGSHSPDADGAEDVSTTGFRGSFGPVWGNPGEWEVAAYMNFEYLKYDFGGDDYWKTMSFPGYNIAMEYYLNSWFVTRGGVRSYNATETMSEEVGVDLVDEYNERAYDFFWTFGLGVDKGNWGIDMALEEQTLHSGYVVLNGNQGIGNDPIAYLSAWLAW